MQSLPITFYASYLGAYIARLHSGSPLDARPTGNPSDADLAAAVDMVRDGFTVRFVDAKLGLCCAHDFSPRDARTLADMAPEVSWIGFRALCSVSRDIARREPLTRENLLAALSD